MNKLGSEHDKMVLKWKNDLEGRQGSGKGVTEGNEFSIDESDELSSDDDNDLNCVNYMACDVASSPKANRYIITGDNLDKTLKPRFMTIEHQTQSLHYFHAYAGLNCLSFDNLTEDVPTSRLLRSLNPGDFLPSLDDCKKLRDNYAVLMARVICKNLKAFESFKDCVPEHIIHKYSTAMAKKSVTVSIIVRSMHCIIYIYCAYRYH